MHISFSEMAIVDASRSLENWTATMFQNHFDQIKAGLIFVIHMVYLIAVTNDHLRPTKQLPV